MSFYDDASLILIPSGYKTSKLYSAKPTDGSGDLTFTRTGSTATRVNSEGLIEECRTNLILNSATLVTQNVTVVAAPYTLSFFGTGSVTLGGTGSGSLAGTGANNRVTLTFTPTAGTLSLTVSGSVTSAQLEIGDIATAYIPTTSAAVTVGPVANLPRLDYTGGGCPKLLMEPTRTNLITYSEAFDNAAWNKGNSSISANTLVSPDGYTNADKIIENTANAGHTVGRGAIGVSIGAAYTLSVFAKAGERTILWVDLYGGTNNAYFNLSLGTILAQNNVTAKIENYGNGWYRCSITTASAPAGSLYPGFSPSITSSSNVYLGNGTSGLYLYGAQLEAGSYATSYIPTWNASVTRNVDSASKTGISSLIGQTEGTLFVDLNYEAIIGTSMFLSIRPNSTNKIEVYRDGQTIYGDILGNNISVLLSKSSSPAGRYKIALGYKSGETALYVNGTSVGTSSTAFSFIVSMADLFINSRSGTTFIEQASYNQALLFNTRLSNTDLANITTL